MEAVKNPECSREGHRVAELRKPRLHLPAVATRLFTTGRRRIFDLDRPGPGLESSSSSSGGSRHPHARPRQGTPPPHQATVLHLPPGATAGIPPCPTIC